MRSSQNKTHSEACSLRPALFVVQVISDISAGEQDCIHDNVRTTVDCIHDNVHKPVDCINDNEHKTVDCIHGNVPK